MPALGDYGAARELDEDTLTRRRRVLGEDHPDTLASGSNLAADLSELGDYEAVTASAATPVAASAAARPRASRRWATPRPRAGRRAARLRRGGLGRWSSRVRVSFMTPTLEIRPGGQNPANRPQVAAGNPPAEPGGYLVRPRSAR